MSVAKPVVGIIMGSRSDWPTLKAAAEVLDSLKVPYETVGEYGTTLKEKLAVEAKRNLEFLDLFALIDDGLNDIVAQRAPALDPLHGRHRLWVVKDTAKGVVVYVYEK